MPMSRPAWIAWYRKAECIASRTLLLPRNENEMLLMPPADLDARQRRLDPARGLDEGDRVVGVLLHAGRDGEDVRVEDDVLGREADLLGQDPVGARRDLDLALDRVGLALLVEGHHHHRRAVAPDQARLMPEALLPFLQADRVDDALALQALAARPRSRSTWSCRS